MATPSPALPDEMPARPTITTGQAIYSGSLFFFFQAKGLRSDALCPCASSAEALTVSVRRPGREGANATGRGVLSMAGLRYVL